MLKNCSVSHYRQRSVNEKHVEWTHRADVRVSSVELCSIIKLFPIYISEFFSFLICK